MYGWPLQEADWGCPAHSMPLGDAPDHWGALNFFAQKHRDYRIVGIILGLNIVILFGENCLAFWPWHIYNSSANIINYLNVHRLSIYNHKQTSSTDDTTVRYSFFTCTPTSPTSRGHSETKSGIALMTNIGPVMSHWLSYQKTKQAIDKHVFNMIYIYIEFKFNMI